MVHVRWSRIYRSGTTKKISSSSEARSTFYVMTSCVVILSKCTMNPLLLDILDVTRHTNSSVASSGGQAYLSSFVIMSEAALPASSPKSTTIQHMSPLYPMKFQHVPSELSLVTSLLASLNVKVTMSFTVLLIDSPKLPSSLPATIRLTKTVPSTSSWSIPIRDLACGTS